MTMTISIWVSYEKADVQNIVNLDIHLSNNLVKLPSSFDDLSVKQVYEKYGEPETVLVTRCDGEPLPPNTPAKAVVPLFLGKYAEKFSLADAHPLLSDFGEGFSPAPEPVLGKTAIRPPRFELRRPNSNRRAHSRIAQTSGVWLRQSGRSSE